MGEIQFNGDAISIGADALGASLGIDPSLVQRYIRQGKITSACERGIDVDVGTYRLTFFYANRRVRFVVDETGSIVRRSTIDFGAPVARMTRRSSL